MAKAQKAKAKAKTASPKKPTNTKSAAAARPKASEVKVTKVTETRASRVKLPNVKFSQQLVLGRLIAELIGTFILTAVVLLSINGLFQPFGFYFEREILEQAKQAGQSIPTFNAPALLAALTLGILVLVIGKLSGSHVNPAITIGLWAVRKIRTAPALLYIASQLLGAMLAVVVITKFVNNPDVALLSQLSTTADWKQIFAEAAGALVFGFGVASVFLGKKEGIEAAAAVGGSLFLGLIIASVGSNAVLNPALALGIGTLALTWQSIVAYIVAPIVGAVLGMVLYKLLRNDVEQVQAD